MDKQQQNKQTTTKKMNTYDKWPDELCHVVVPHISEPQSLSLNVMSNLNCLLDEIKNHLRDGLWGNHT